MMRDRIDCIPSLGLSHLDPCKVFLEQHVQNRPYKIFKGNDSSVGAAEEATTQQKLIDSKARMSLEKLKSFGDLTRRRVKSTDPTMVGNVKKESDTLQCFHSEDQVRTIFEDAFEKV